MKKSKKCSLFMLVLLVGAALFISCQPTAGTDPSYLKNSDPAKVDNSNLPITPIEEIHVTRSAPEVDITEYRLTVDGLVEKPLTLPYEAVMAYPTVTETVCCLSALASSLTMLSGLECR